MLSLNQDKCIQCGACVEDCLRGALTLNEEKVEHDASKCMWCGHCLAVCPRDCIIIDGDGYDCEEVEDLGFAKAPNKFQIRNMILGRRSVRRFTDQEVTDEELGLIMEAAKYSPTGINRQGNEFIIVNDEAVKELAADTVAAFKRLIAAGSIDAERTAGMQALCDKYDNEGKDPFYYGAPVVIFVFADTDVDGAICATNMGWMAQAQQLGYCFARLPVGAFDDSEFAEKWKAPEKKCAMSLLIGNPEPEYFCSVPRKDPSVTVF